MTAAPRRALQNCFRRTQVVAMALAATGAMMLATPAAAASLAPSAIAPTIALVNAAEQNAGLTEVGFRRKFGHRFHRRRHFGSRRFRRGQVRGFRRFRRGRVGGFVARRAPLGLSRRGAFRASQGR